MLKLEGIIPAMVTPFTQNQELNEAGLRKLVNHYIHSGVHGLFCLGTNGEFFSLSYDEKLRVTEIVVDEAAGRVPVYAGSGGISTAETIKLTKKFEEMGVDAVSIITPYFLSFSQSELVAFYRHVADSTVLPILLYNIPGLTNNHLQPLSVVQLAKEENIVGIKDSSGRLDTILQYIDHTDDDFSVFAGTDSLILPTLMAGGKGAIAATANFVPDIVVAIYNNWKQGDMKAAQKAQNLLRPLRNSFQLGTLPSVLKEAMNRIDLPAGPPRLPVKSLSDDNKQELAEMIQFYVDQGCIHTTR
jgi:4-hydroxy-tetrahydrodipicolinate synthase